MEKPSLPKGTRDFGPAEMARRQFIFQSAREVFQKFGFLPLETPAMENLSTLTGKYGEEGDQLLFKVLNSGDFLKDVELPSDSKSVLPKISEKGLRYDLTVPFARYVVMNRHEITFPFKRYQMQPVWRADRPQKGRYREFWQCDADVVGTTSLVCEAEIILMITKVMQRLNIGDFTIRINHRGILTGICEAIGAQGNESALFVAIDKLEKAGKEKVVAEMMAKGFTSKQVETLMTLLETKGTTEEKLNYAEQQFKNDHATAAVKDIRQILSMVNSYGVTAPVELNFTLARGLSYYTGTIFEVVINNVAIGSVSGGGRYDDLTGVFGMPGISGVGISFGVDRIYDAMESLNLFSNEISGSSTVLVTHMDEVSFHHGLTILSELHKGGIAAEIYPDITKLKKQLEFANKKNIPFVLVIGEEEMKSGLLTLKEMKTGEQGNHPINVLISRLTGLH